MLCVEDGGGDRAVQRSIVVSFLPCFFHASEEQKQQNTCLLAPFFWVGLGIFAHRELHL